MENERKRVKMRRGIRVRVKESSGVRVMKEGE